MAEPPLLCKEGSGALRHLWLFFRLYPTPQYFCDAPCLRDTSAREEGIVGIEDFADRSDAGLGEVRGKAIQEFASAREIIRVNAQPCIDERTDQPCPNRALVIGRIA